MSEVSTTVNKKSRKDIIKDITIAFLVILLLLTFFSNTIMNYSLPEVAIQQVQEGNISPMIRGTGTVEASDPYNVKVTQERVIKSVAVTEGSHVEKGDVLYYLEDKESTELTEAETKLEELTQTYEAALFSGDIDDASITRIRSGVTLSFDDYQAKLKAASDRYDAAKAADEAAQATIDEKTQAQSYTSAQYNYDEATPQYEDAEITYRLAQIEEQITDAQETKDNAKEKRDALKKTDKNYSKYDQAYWLADQTLDALNEEKSQLTIKQASNTKDVSQMTTQAGQVDSDYTREMASLQDTKNKTALELERATTDRTELLTEIGKEIELCNQRDDIEEQKKTVENQGGL